jgi:phage shock protein A
MAKQMRKLEQKLAEAQAKVELLVAQHRRTRAAGKAADAQMAKDDRSKLATFDRMKHKVGPSAKPSRFWPASRNR